MLYGNAYVLVDELERNREEGKLEGKRTELEDEEKGEREREREG